MTSVFISLGTNLGNRLENLRRAHALLSRYIKNIRSSIVLETKALLPENAPSSWDIPYLNQVIVAQTSLDPLALLEKLKEIEHALGRPAAYERWAPRVLDLDILFYTNTDEPLNTPALTLPHPELVNRPFILHLLALLAPQLPCPTLNHPYSQLSFGEIAHRFLKPGTLFENAFVLQPQLVGIVNITPDSHSDGGRYFKIEDAIAQALHLHSKGASIIELGAQSTRVGAQFISEEEEWARLSPVLSALNSASTPTRPIVLSIDTFYDSIALKALKYPTVSWLNNVCGLFKPATLRAIATSGRSYMAMHALSVPHDPAQVLDFHTSPTQSLIPWGKATIAALISYGFSLEQIILDPGIGFSKSTYQSLSLIQHAKALKALDTRLLVGHARKNFMTTFCTRPRPERDIETLAISQKLAEQGVDYLRVYDVEGHQRFFTAQAAL